MRDQWEKFKHRTLTKVFLGYAVVAWVLIQVIEAVLPTFESPLWVAQSITFLLILFRKYISFEFDESSLQSSLLFFAYSKTRARQGLSSLFVSETDVFRGLSLPSELLIALLLIINLLSFIKVQMNGRIEGFASNYSFTGKTIIMLGIICGALVRIASMTLFFSTNLGLFDLLHHYQGRNIKLNKLLRFFDL